MVKKGAKKRTTAGSTKTKTRTVYRTVRRRAKRAVVGRSIPGAMATVGLLAVNYNKLAYFTRYSNLIPSNVQQATSRVRASGILSKDQLVKDAGAVVGGLVAGEVVKKFAPRGVKKALDKVARKIPKVI